MRAAVIFSLVAPALVLAACTSRTVLDDSTGSVAADEIHVWFVKPAGEELRLVQVRRSHAPGSKLRAAVTELLSGPTAFEMKQGLDTEIPRGTILIGLNENGSTIELNLSRRFASGGGSSSLETRLEQLSRTVKEAAGARPVFLDVEGERLTTAAGEGLEIRQPIN